MSTAEPSQDMKPKPTNVKVLHAMVVCSILLLSLNSAPGQARTTRYTYDSSHRLTAVAYDQQTAIHYDYDASSNRTNQIVVGQANRQADYNGDGMPDLWELTYFGTLQAGANADPDQDGANNLAESRAWTNPLDAASNLHFTGATNTPAGFTLRWEAHSNTTYRVWWCGSLSGWQATNSVVVTSGSYVDSSPANTRRFYRVSVEP
jgi:hypothetical protein